MTDVTGAGASIEPVPLIPLETAPTHEPASPAAAPAPSDEPVAASPPVERALPEIEHAIGAPRQAVLDHLLATEGDHSMAQIKAALPNVLPGTVEACVRREWEAGRLVRVSPGFYRLAPAKPPEAKPAPTPEPDPPGVLTEEEWLAAMDAWFTDRS